jgi:hypothetical protein
MTPEPSAASLAVLAGIYRRGADDLAALLKGSDFQRGKATILLRQVDAISQRVAGESDRWVSAETQSLYEQSAQAVDREIAPAAAEIGPAGSARARADFMKINEGAVEQFARQISRDLAAANRDLADQGRRIIRRTSQMVISDAELSKTIAQGLVSGGNKNKIGQALRERLAAGGRELLESGKMSETDLAAIVDFDAGVIQAGKRRMPLNHYCRMVASFQLRQATVAATRERLADAGQAVGDPDRYDLVIIRGPISGDFCDFYVNKVFSVSGRSSEFPPLDAIPNAGPPFHPNCTHTISPFVRVFATGRDIKRGRINDQFLNIDGRAAQKKFTGPEQGYAARRKRTPANRRSSRPE